ncbi:hypothetical protein TNCV_1237301 [Trichonephila clavipes]|nr:hypothetical protein TNCV_1237301 [Trichonephila clavipes]
MNKKCTGNLWLRLPNSYSHEHMVGVASVDLRVRVLVPFSDQGHGLGWHVMSSSLVLLKINRVPLLIKSVEAQISSRCCSGEVMGKGCQLRCPRHLSMVRNYEVRCQQTTCDVSIISLMVAIKTHCIERTRAC